MEYVPQTFHLFGFLIWSTESSRANGLRSWELDSSGDKEVAQWTETSGWTGKWLYNWGSPGYRQRYSHCPGRGRRAHRHRFLQEERVSDFRCRKVADSLKRLRRGAIHTGRVDLSIFRGVQFVEPIGPQMRPLEVD